MQEFIRRYPFATVVSYRDGIHVSHLPVLLDPQRGPYGTIVGHPARANAHWRDFNGETGTTCVFHGPHAYISPTWYAERPAVPTWNYAVVLAIGTPAVIDDQQRLAEIIDETLEPLNPRFTIRSRIATRRKPIGHRS